MCNISPQSPGFHEKDDDLKRSNVGVTGIGPVRLLSEMLKIWSVDWFNAGIEPLNRFESNRRMYNLSRVFKEMGSGPVKLLWERSRVLRRWRVEMEGGTVPVKELWERKRTLRLIKPERSGRGPVRELF